MARKRRIYGPPNCSYNITCRINERALMCFQDRKVARMIFQVLAEAKKKFGGNIFMFTLMGNHDHKNIKVQGAGEQISRIMHWINFTIAMRYNKLTGHTGRLWRERFKSQVIQDWSYFLNCGAYIARNPERANIASVDEYPYSSAIFLYKLLHPFPEFEVFRALFNEPFPGYFDTVKQLIEAQQRDEKLSCGISMAPKAIGRPKKLL